MRLSVAIQTFFAKMFSKYFWILLCACFVIPSVRMEECTTQNITCEGILTSDGYTYDFQPKNQSAVLEIEITRNGTQIVSGKIGRLNFSPEVVRCDEKSITMKTCGNLHVKFIHNEGEKISESCQDFNTAGDNNKDIHSSTGCESSCISIISGVLGVFVLFALFALLCWLWRKLQKGKWRGECLSCLGNKKRNSDTQVYQSVEQNYRNCRQELLLKETSGNAKSTSAAEDVSINMDTDNTIPNDDVPRVNGVAAQNGLNGNMRQDPGGGKDKEQHCNGNLQNCEQRTLDEPSFNRHKDNGSLSSRNHGSAREEASDETAGDEGQALVDSSGPSRESLAPPHDVEKGTRCEEKTLLNNILY